MVCACVSVCVCKQETADATRILYGGSVTPESVDDLMARCVFCMHMYIVGDWVGQ